MKSFSILYREESRPPRFLTWPLVFVVAGVMASVVGRELDERQPGAFTFLVFAGVAVCTVLLLEFVAVGVAVTTTEVRFCFSPFYQRRIVIADIQHWEVRTYVSPASPSADYSWRPPRHCVELTMKDGALFTISSTHAEEVSNAIRKARELHSRPGL
jgi:hypothetical protein